jgi:hypothetical protein
MYPLHFWRVASWFRVWRIVLMEDWVFRKVEIKLQSLEAFGDLAVPATAETALAGLEVEPAIRVFIGIGLHGLVNDSAFHVSCVTAVQACLMLIFQQGVDDQLILLL